MRLLADRAHELGMPIGGRKYNLRIKFQYRIFRKLDSSSPIAWSTFSVRAQLAFHKGGQAAAVAAPLAGLRQPAEWMPWNYM
jgi:hypothetical protein